MTGAENEPERPAPPSRRSFVFGGAAIGAAGALAPRRRRAGRLSSAQARLLDDAMAGQVSAAASLSDIEHGAPPPAT